MRPSPAEVAEALFFVESTGWFTPDEAAAIVKATLEEEEA